MIKLHDSPPLSFHSLFDSLCKSPSTIEQIAQASLAMAFLKKYSEIQTTSRDGMTNEMRIKFRLEIKELSFDIYNKALTLLSLRLNKEVFLLHDQQNTMIVDQQKEKEKVLQDVKLSESRNSFLNSQSKQIKFSPLTISVLKKNLPKKTISKNKKCQMSSSLSTLTKRVSYNPGFSSDFLVPSPSSEDLIIIRKAFDKFDDYL